MLRRFSAHDPTNNMLKRELVGDVFQITLKYTAYHLSQSQAMKAELMRSVMDSTNHILLYFTNKRSNQLSDEFYNHSK
jgi:divalent metal cation (Fe/Co/Zn/Cd) transporter